VRRSASVAKTLENLAGLCPVPLQNSEYVVEACYTCRPLNGLEARPNIRYVIDLSGTGRNPERPCIWAENGGQFLGS
jgi:hypothetical protein